MLFAVYGLYLWNQKLCNRWNLIRGLGFALAETGRNFYQEGRISKLLFCCDECPYYENCSESGTLLEGCCKKCIYFEDCHFEEIANEEDEE